MGCGFGRASVLARAQTRHGLTALSISTLDVRHYQVMGNDSIGGAIHRLDRNTIPVAHEAGLPEAIEHSP